MMNIFRLLGDFSHLAAMILLLIKICVTKSCAGISGKSQVLYALVFVSRYLDLITVFISPYNMVMKLLFITISNITVYLVYVKYRSKDDLRNDKLRFEALIIFALMLALIYNHEYSILEVLWTFSIYLEALAILPQLFLSYTTGVLDSFTIYYLASLGSYRFLYILNWIYRYNYELRYDLIADISGVVQTVFYCIFFYLYACTSQVRRQDPEEVASSAEKGVFSIYQPNDSLMGRPCVVKTDSSKVPIELDADHSDLPASTLLDKSDHCDSSQLKVSSPPDHVDQLQ